jgi:hypothetical protein
MECAASSAPNLGSRPNLNSPLHVERIASLSTTELLDPDLRFRDLVGAAAWAELPPAVRRRFSKRFKNGEAILYNGHVIETQLSRAGRFLSVLAHAIGSPLPGPNGNAGAAAVTVIQDAASGHQNWTRTYERAGQFPQVVHSMKRFAGPTGLEEYVGAGIGMSLVLSVEAGALVFRSGHYFFELGRFRAKLPRLLSPGVMEIIHRDEPVYCGLANAFSFRLTLTHPVFGCLVHQLAYFKEV